MTTRRKKVTEKRKVGKPKLRKLTLKDLDTKAKASGVKGGGSYLVCRVEMK